MNRPELALRRVSDIPKSELRLYSELARIDDDSTRQAVYAKVKPLRFGIFGLIGFLILMAVVWFDPLGIGGHQALVPGTAGAAVILCVLAKVWNRRTVRRAIWTEMVHHGIPICLCCGYDTRDLPERRCPECGEAFEPPAMNRRG